jgi:LytS/YehU family sensor histidine kinase
MSQEIEYLKNYIALQKLRTESSPSILIQDEINGQGCDYLIAPMLLVPFVENAFKHGISLQEESWIKIQLDCDERGVHFKVRNSVHYRRDNDPEERQSGIGMKNVINRLKLVYGGRHEFYVHNDEREFFVQLVIYPNK